MGPRASSAWFPVPFTRFCVPFPAPPDDGTQTARTTTVESSFVRRSESKASSSLLRLPACRSPPKFFLKHCVFNCTSPSPLYCGTSLLWQPPLAFPGVQPGSSPHSLFHRRRQQQQQHHSPNQDLFLFLFLVQKDGQVSMGRCLWRPHCLPILQRGRLTY